MTISKLQQFHAVCKFQNVTKAAEFLHISQPSVSAAIRELEAEFGINLFRHEGRRLVLTAEGRFLLEQSAPLLRDFEELTQRLHDLGRNRNLLRISIPPMAGTIFFEPLYNAFKAGHPQVTLSVTECGSLQAEKLLNDGKLDIVMASLRQPPDDRFRYMPIGRTQLVFCVNRSHRLAQMKTVSIPLLQKEPLILFGEDSVPSEAVRQMFSSQGFSPNVLLCSSQISLIRRFLSDGTAGAFLLDALVRDEPDIIALPFAEPVFFDTMLMWSRDRYLYSDADSFLRFSRNYFAGKA